MLKIPTLSLFDLSGKKRTKSLLFWYYQKPPQLATLGKNAETRSRSTSTPDTTFLGKSHWFSNIFTCRVIYKIYKQQNIIFHEYVVTYLTLAAVGGHPRTLALLSKLTNKIPPSSLRHKENLNRNPLYSPVRPDHIHKYFTYGHFKLSISMKWTFHIGSSKKPADLVGESCYAFKITYLLVFLWES